MSRFFLAVVLPVLAIASACDAYEPPAFDAELAETWRAQEVVADECEELADVDATEEQEWNDEGDDATDADVGYGCGSCACDCSQVACTNNACTPAPTGQGDCKQNGSSCAGTECTCDCYDDLGRGCDAAGNTGTTPERLTVTAPVGGNACKFQ